MAIGGATALMLGTLLASACGGGGGKMGRKKTNQAAINLFGFEESEVHHIHTSVEHSGRIFLVRYNPRRPGNLEWIDCPVEVNYQYYPANGRRIETMQIRNEADLQMKLPLSFARYSGYLESGSDLSFEYVTVGSYEALADFQIPKGDPDCARATHYVTTLSVGAFAFSEQRTMKAGAEATMVGGAGGQANLGRAKGASTSLGDLQACMRDDEQRGCRTPLQILIKPLARRQWRKGKLDDGYVEPQPPYPDNENLPVPVYDDREMRARGLTLSMDEQTWRPGYFVAIALQALLADVVSVSEGSNFGMDADASSVVGGFVDAGQTISVTRPMTANRPYVIFASSAIGSDLLLELYSLDGRLLASDDLADGVLVLQYTPTVTEGYKVAIHAPTDPDFGAIAIMMENGWDIPANTLRDVFQNLLDSGAAASQLMREKTDYPGLIFHEGEMSLHGTVLQPGQTITTSGFHLAQEPAVVIAVGHNDNINLDMSISDSSGVVGEDNGPEAAAVSIIAAPTTSEHELAVSYTAGSEPTLTASMILKGDPKR